MKDFVSVTKDSVKMKHQKCLLLLNIKELFLKFKKEYPTVEIGFSRFCELTLTEKSIWEVYSKYT